MTSATLLAVLVLTGVFLFMVYYFGVLRPRKGTLDWIPLQDHRPFTFAVPRHRMEKKDALPVLLITAAYALTAFFQLGSTTAPQAWYDFSDGQSYTIQVDGDPLPVSRIWAYDSLGTGGYDLEVSEDGQRWSTLWTRVEKDEWGGDKTVYYWESAQGSDPPYALSQSYLQLFKWQDILPQQAQQVRYIRITGRADQGQQTLRLAKLLFLDDQGRPIRYSWSLVKGHVPQEDWADFSQVFAVDDTVPEAISWRNSAYFDEIYHPRTALEHIQGRYPYEITHPPLGKLILGLGVRMFGMTPFGWRFMGALFGVLMVPIFYVFVKNIFGKRAVAVCGTILFATEFMHLTQTRIATIDTYGVFFILLAYLFFYRWLTAPATPKKNGKVSEGYGQLALSGLFWGIGCACKWTVIYAGVGLAALYLIHVILRIRAWDKGENERSLGGWIFKTLLVSVLCFVVLPAAIYTASYIPYAASKGDVTFAAVLDEMWRNQKYMLSYHNGVHSYHPYASRWYQWLVDGRPILYYYKDVSDGAVEKFAALTNPLTTWLGLLALFACMARCFRRLWAKLALLWSAGAGCAVVCWLVGRVENGDFDPALAPEKLRDRLVLLGLCLALYLALSALIAWATTQRRSALDVFLTLGFAAQFLPWVLIGRVTFAYHYFPATLFLLLAICALFDRLMECPRARWRVPVYGVTGASAGLYALFYPYLTGLSMPGWYFNTFLRFLPSWP